MTKYHLIGLAKLTLLPSMKAFVSEPGLIKNGLNVLPNLESIDM
jgi:hypothetical protein